MCHHPPVLLHRCLILSVSLPMEYAISQPYVARCSPRRPRNRCLLSLLARKSSFFNCNVMERLSITFRPSCPARRACMLSFVEAPALSPSNNEKWNLCRTGQMRTGHICPLHCPNYKLDPLANSIRDWNPRHSLSAVWTHFYPSLLPLLFSMHSLLFSLPVEHLAPLASSQLYFHPETIRAARRGQGGRLTTLNFRPGAVTPLNLGHVSNFLSSNVSREQTR